MPDTPANSNEFPKAYDPVLIEPRWSQYWVDEKLFVASREGAAPVFSIAIPPPNVTGYIHIGHMLEHTQIDALTRWHRMQGNRTLWLPGMDHAGIATQVVVERELAKESLKREQIGREEFEKRVWIWKAKSGGTIKQQMIRLGDSCDWSRERFTLDPALYRAVMEAFLRLYHEGLIYRGRYIVNWCPRCQTALSDLETVHEDRNGHLWYIRYPVAGAPGESLVVATTRPETMLGDTAVAVNPEDERYRHLVGKNILLPLVDREIPIVADTFVDREFGTGAVKVTPAHDPNDFELGRRHNLAEIDVMTGDGRMGPNAGPYAGLDRFEARKRILADLETLGLLVKTEDYPLSVGLCDRCKTVVEPRVSTQWFCKMRGMADVARAAVTDGLIAVVPDNQRKIFLDWLENIRDWCISRQLWWGHRIPMWHCSCGGVTPARDSRVEVVDGRAVPASPPEKCAQCGGGELTQDHDVLDTWFSSGLWPLSTLGWPDDTPDLRAFYPTTLMINGYDILFFWDARMAMMCTHLATGKTVAERIPFRSLYLHSIVRDEHGQKMSKMRGNVVDPLDWMAKFGTDALRFTLMSKAAPGTDIALSEDAILGYRAFANKIWNAARFLFVNLEKFEAATGTSIAELAAPEIREKAPYSVGGALPLADRWIFSRMAEVVATVNDALANFRFHEAAYTVYHFFWDDFCDWYIEWTKPALGSENKEAAVAAWRNIFAIFDAALRMLHPLMAFLTEELWHRLPQRAGATSIALEPFPAPPPAWRDAQADAAVTRLQELITSVRNMRHERKIDSKIRVPAHISSDKPSDGELLAQNREVFLRLAGLSDFTFAVAAVSNAIAGLRITGGTSILLEYEAPVDVGAEMARLRKEKDRLAKDLESKRGRLADESFRSKAPARVVEQMEAALAERSVEFDKIAERLVQLEKSAETSPAP